MLSQVVELVERKSRFAITSHSRPDGDSLGSSLGLYWLLRALNKSVDVIMRDEVPVAYARLPGARDIITASNIAAHADSNLTTPCSSLSVRTLRAPVLQTSPSNSSST
jgi:phosphoesterase RecJ-like protein